MSLYPVRAHIPRINAEKESATMPKARIQVNTLTDGSLTYDVVLSTEDESITIPCLSAIAAEYMLAEINDAFAKYGV